MSNGNRRHNGHEEELEMLVGMGFDRNAAKRAIEVNSGNMDQALTDLTSGEELPPEPRRSSIQPRDRGLNSLVVPQRSTSLEQQDAHQQERSRNHHVRRKKSSKRKSSHRRRREHDEGAQQQRAPTQRISEFDVTNETMQPQTSERRSIAAESWVESTVAENQSNAIPNQMNQSSGAIRNAQQQQPDAEGLYNFSEQISWPSSPWPGTGNEAPSTPTNRGQTLENSSPRLSNGLPVGESQYDGSMDRISEGASFQDLHRSNNETIDYQEPAPDPYAITAVVTDDEEASAAAAGTRSRSYPEYTPRSSSVPRGGASGGGSSWFDFSCDLSWCQPSYSFGFLVFTGIILVVPAVVITLAFIIPREVAPEAVYLPLSEILTKLLNESSLDEGSAMATFGTPQFEAFNWLLNSSQPHTDGRSYESTGAQIGTMFGNGTVYSLPYGDLQTKQRYAMATLFFSTGGDAWATNDGWLNQTTNECLDWFHRYTAEFCAGGSVVNLDLSDNDMLGTIPNELSILAESLKSLSLDGNLLSGPIPTSIGLLTNLASLDLSGNNLKGTVPVEIQNLTNLEYLYLGENDLTGEFTCSDLIPYCYVSCMSDNETCRSL